MQIGSYKKLPALIEYCNHITKLTDKNIIIKVSDKNGEKTYKVIVGTFTTKQEAISFNDRFQRKENKNSFIITF